MLTPAPNAMHTTSATSNGRMLAAVSWPTPITETISAAATIVASMNRSPWAKLISSMMPYTIV